MKREALFIRRNDETKREVESSKGKRSEEAIFKQIYREIKEQFSKEKEEAEVEYYYKRQKIEEENKMRMKEEKDRIRQEAITKQQDKIRWKYLRSREKTSLNIEEKQFIQKMDTKFPSSYKKIGFMLYYHFDVDKVDSKEMTNAQDINDEEEARFEANEKEKLFEMIVKEFRSRYEKRGDLKCLQECYRVIGNEYLKKHDIKEALKYFQAFKILCDKNKAFIMKMIAYKEIGFCYKLVKQYRSALINFKKLLQLAWYRNHRGWEMKSYDFIGIAYYYLGEIEKSKYYHKRMWEGIYENENSNVRIIAINSLRLKLEEKLLTDDRVIPQIKSDTSYIINQSDEEENDLPSPRTGSGEEHFKLLPFYMLKKGGAGSLPNLKNSQKPPKSGGNAKGTLTTRVKPFMLISHLSPNESPNNYFYVEQMNSFRVRGEQSKNHN